MCLVELTVLRKQLHRSGTEEKGYSTYMQGQMANLLTLQVGSRGVSHYDSFSLLANILCMHSEYLDYLLKSTARAAIVGSFKIWCS